MKYLLALILLAVSACSEPEPKADGMEKIGGGSYWQIHKFKDPDSACEYIVVLGNGPAITPRLVNGKPFCGSAR